MAPRNANANLLAGFPSICGFFTVLLMVLVIPMVHLSSSFYLRTKFRPKPLGASCLDLLVADGFDSKCLDEGQALYNWTGDAYDQNTTCNIDYKSARCMTEQACLLCNESQIASLLDWQSWQLSMMYQGECRQVSSVWDTTLDCAHSGKTTVIILVGIVLFVMFLFVLASLVLLYYTRKQEETQDREWAALNGDDKPKSIGKASNAGKGKMAYSTGGILSKIRTTDESPSLGELHYAMNNYKKSGKEVSN